MAHVTGGGAQIAVPTRRNRVARGIAPCMAAGDRLVRDFANDRDTLVIQ